MYEDSHAILCSSGADRLGPHRKGGELDDKLDEEADGVDQIGRKFRVRLLGVLLRQLLLHKSILKIMIQIWGPNVHL